MSKRVILAFVLTFVILIGWNVVVERPRRAARLEQLRREQALKERAADSLLALGDTTGARAVFGGRVRERPARVVPGPAPGGPDRVAGGERPSGERLRPGRLFAHVSGDTLSRIEPAAIIVSERVRGELSPVGGAFTSWRVRSYHDAEGQPVELVLRDPVPLDPKRRNLDFAAPRDFWPGGPQVGMTYLSGGTEWLSDVLFERVDGGPAQIVLNAQNPRATVVLRAVSGGLLVQKAYGFRYDSYEIDLGVQIRGIEPVDEVAGYQIGWLGGLPTTERNVKRDMQSSYAAGLAGAEMSRKGIGRLKPEDTHTTEGTLWWADVQTKYFIMALIPNRVKTGRIEIWGDRALGIGQVSMAYPVRDLQASVSDDFRMYYGPIDFKTLKAYDVGLEKTVNLGWKLFRPVSSLALSFLIFLHGFIPNYGVIIILLSLLTKVIFYRLTHKSMKSMKDMQKVQPLLAALKEKYKDDRQKLNEATMKLYKEHNINPLGGCLPLVLQMPVFIALFQVLNNTIELRGAPFVLWIQDLAAEDTLFYFPFALPFLGNQFNPLPLLMGASTILQSALGGSPMGGGPEGMPSAGAAMKWVMPIFMMVIFYHMPSGLVLYWFVNNLLSIAQQWYIRRGESETAPAKA